MLGRRSSCGSEGFLMKRLSAAVLVSLFGATAWFAAPAGAQDCPYPETECVDVGAVTLDPVVVPVERPTASAPVAIAGKQQLPVTGSDTAYLVGTGLVLVVGGVVLTKRARAAREVV